MATDLRRAKSTAASKYDAFVSAQLAKAESRIRLLDLMAGLLGFAALALAYVVAMVLCDSKLMLSQETRQLALYLFLIGGAGYLFYVVVRPLRLQVNPYYAARQVEQQLPHAKNSIVNWVDLHEQQLPPAILGALGQRAAKDMSRVDVDHAISGRRAAWMGGLAGLFAVAFIASFFLLGPAPFLSLLKRTFNPFGSGGVSTRTQLTLRKPEGGNAAVTVGRGINFVVEVNGKVPDPKAADAVKLLYRYEDGDPWLERRLIQEPSREWTTSLSAIEVRNGFWYKITGGDAATEEYQVAVRAAPAIIDFLATYHFRPYVARADEIHRERELKALRGTEVLLRVRTNRTLRDGRLEFAGKSGSTTVRGEVDPNDPHTLFVRFVLEEDGKYRLYFTSTESEAYTDSTAYSVTAIPDQPPVVELTKPGQDIRLPADALLHLEGKAGDDIGVKALTLQMRVVGGDKLRGQPYRGEDALRLADGGYPAEVEYEDFVELARVQDEKGRLVALRAGMELEYWLEASDACDYPHANVGASKHYRVVLTEPEKNEQKSQREKQQAAKKKQQHEQKQDQKRQQENQQRQQQRKEQEARNQEEENKSKDADKGAAGDPSQSKDGEQPNNGASKDNNGQKGESKDGSNEPNNGEQNGGSSAEDRKIEEQIKKALERKQAREDAKSEAKPDKSEDKETPSGNSEGSGKSEDERKGADKQDAKEAGKGDNRENPMPGDKSESKDADPMKGAGEAGEGKPRDDPQASKDAAQTKSPSKDKDQNAAGARKPNDAKEETKGESAADAKDKGSTSRGEAKDGGKHQEDKEAEPKQGDSSPKGKQSTAGDAKPSRAKDEDDKTAKGESKPDPDAQARKATAKDIEDLARSLQGKDSQENEKAKQQLERIQKQAEDLQSRAKAKEALEKGGAPDGANDNRNPTNGNASSIEPKSAGNDRERSSSSKKSGEKGTNTRDQNNKGFDVEPKNERKYGDGSPGNGSSADKNSDRGTPSNEKSDRGSADERKKKGEDAGGPQRSNSSSSEKNDNDMGSGDGDGPQKSSSPGSDKNGKSSSPRGDSQGPEAAAGGNRAGGGRERRNGQGDAGRGNEGMNPESKPAQPHPHRAAQMQLEEFAKQVNKDILKDAGVSEEAWKKYLESKRKQLSPPEKARPETPSAPQQANQLPSMGGRAIQPSASGAGDTHGPDRGQPPPGYRDPFREFTKQMSKKN